MSFNNPDYPDIDSCGGFLQHTYQQPQGNPYDSMYYGGGSVNPFNQYGYNGAPDSRRNIGYPNQTTGMGMNPQQTMPNNGQQQVMPFSSYPSGVPNNQNPQFNALVESRRNTGVNNNPVSSPWANQNHQVQQPMANMMSQPPQVQPLAPQQITAPWNNPYGYGHVETSMGALYNNSISEFDRKNPAWDNVYTMPRPIEAPPVKWNTGFGQSNCIPMTNGDNVYSYQWNCPQFPKMNVSYLDIAKNNFANV